MLIIVPLLISSTIFSAGYYADPEAECQVFHICTADGQGGLAKYSFLCPNGTIFNQNYFICDWWFNFDCAEAESLYSRNDEIRAEQEANIGAASDVQASYTSGADYNSVDTDIPAYDDYVYEDSLLSEDAAAAADVSSSYGAPAGDEDLAAADAAATDIPIYEEEAALDSYGAAPAAAGETEAERAARRFRGRSGRRGGRARSGRRQSRRGRARSSSRRNNNRRSNSRRSSRRGGSRAGRAFRG